MNQPTNHSSETLNITCAYPKTQTEFSYVSASHHSAIVIVSSLYQKLSDKEKLEMLSKLNDWTYNEALKIFNQTQ